MHTITGYRWNTFKIEPEDKLHEPLIVEFNNHDGIFFIIEKLKQKDPFNDKEQATQFAIELNV